MSTECWLRRALLTAAAATYIGAAVELVLVEHYEGVWQLVPFGVIAVGLLAIGMAWSAPTERARVLKVVGAVAVVASVLGVYFHLEGNWTLVAEVRPDQSAAARAWDALSGGNPLLAPGMVALAGVLGAVAGARGEERTDT